MSVEKAIQLLHEAKILQPVCHYAEHWRQLGRHSPDCAWDYLSDALERVDDALAELQKQPEPTEFTAKIRKDLDDWCGPYCLIENMGDAHEALEEACDIIEQQAARIKELESKNESPPQR